MHEYTEFAGLTCGLTAACVWPAAVLPSSRPAVPINHPVAVPSQPAMYGRLARLHAPGLALLRHSLYPVCLASCPCETDGWPWWPAPGSATLLCCACLPRCACPRAPAERTAGDGGLRRLCRAGAGHQAGASAEPAGLHPRPGAQQCAGVPALTTQPAAGGLVEGGYSGGGTCSAGMSTGMSVGDAMTPGKVVDCMRSSMFRNRSVS